MSGPTIVCVICGKGAGIFSPICSDCSDHMEAVNGICCDDDVAQEDRPLPTTTGLFDQIPKPRDPYGCENPVSQADEGD